MKKYFGTLKTGEQVYLYTIQSGKLEVQITDLGASIVRLYAPDPQGNVEDVVLGYDDPNDYVTLEGLMGAVVGRNANRIKNASFIMNNRTYTLPVNERYHSLHSGPDFYACRIWSVESHLKNKLVLSLTSGHGDQGFPGQAQIRVTYALKPGGELSITYDAISDRDTVFNLTNHTFFNLSGHKNTSLAMQQELSMPARVFATADEQSIPTGNLCPVAGTAMDFRTPKPIGRDIEEPYDQLLNQLGYDHSFEVFTAPCAILRDPFSGRTMAVETDCPAVHLYSGNYLDNPGKDGVRYHKRSGICLETQFYPNAVNNPQWKQPFFKAGQPYHSVTKYIFK